MEIRSVTLFCDAGRSPAVYAPFLKAARGAFPVRVQSMRLGTTPFPDWLPRRDAARAAALAEAWRAAGVDYVSLGPVQLRHDPAWLAVIPDLLADTDGVFASIEIATTEAISTPVAAAMRRRLSAASARCGPMASPTSSWARWPPAAPATPSCRPATPAAPTPSPSLSRRPTSP